MKGYGIMRKDTGSIVLSRPDTTAEYWQADLETLRRNTAIQGRNAEYVIVPVKFSRRGVYSVQQHERVVVLKPTLDKGEK